MMSECLRRFWFGLFILIGKQKFVLKSCGHSDITCMSENNLILCAGHAGMEGTGRFWNLTDGLYFLSYFDYDYAK